MEKHYSLLRIYLRDIVDYAMFVGQEQIRLEQKQHASSPRTSLRQQVIDRLVKSFGATFPHYANDYKLLVRNAVKAGRCKSANRSKDAYIYVKAAKTFQSNIEKDIIS